MPVARVWAVGTGTGICLQPTKICGTVTIPNVFGAIILELVPWRDGMDSSGKKSLR